MTAVAYELADADGDDYARMGADDAERYAHAHDTQKAPGKELFGVRDVGREALLAGRTAVAGLAENFHTDRIMPQRIGRRVVEQVFVGPDNYIG